MFIFVLNHKKSLNMKLAKTLLSTFILLISITACNSPAKKDVNQNYPTIGSIRIIDDEAKKLLNIDAPIEVLDSGFVWTEGPLWIEADSTLLFSDVPANTIYKWKEGKKSEVYLTPSGYTGEKPFTGKEPGSNGLILNNDKKLALAQHGNHQIAYMDAPLNAPSPKFVTLANAYEGKRINSPNDLIQDRSGNYYFTDPIYGLEKPEDQELPFMGIYKLSTDGKLTLLVDSVLSPNGLALTNDEKYLLVTNSDNAKSCLYEFELSPNSDKVVAGRIVRNFTPDIKGRKDVPDGFKIDKQGNIFASGPEGLLILNKDYKHIAQLVLPIAVSNCWLADNDKTLYITASDKILRLRLK